MKQPLILRFLLVSLFAACSGKAEMALTPFTPNLSRSNYKAWYNYARPEQAEYAWTLWNWSPQLAPAARLASAEGKPLLIWLENGHPLGHSSTIGIQRCDFWTDTSLNAPLSKFRCAADDLQWLLPAEDAEGQFLSSLLEQSADHGSALQENGGVLAASPGGGLLGIYAGTDAAELKLMLTSALQEWDNLPREQRRLADLTAMVSDQRSAELFPDDGLAIEIHRRPMAAEMDPSAARTAPWRHDYLWFTKAEVASMLVSKSGEKVVVPVQLAQRFALFILVDDLNSMGEPFQLEDLQQSDLTFTGMSKIGDNVRFTVSGAFAAENSDHGMHCVVEGDGSINLAQGLILSLNMSVQAQSWGEEVTPTNKDMWPLLVMALHRVESFEGSHRITPTQFTQ